MNKIHKKDIHLRSMEKQLKYSIEYFIISKVKCKPVEFLDFWFFSLGDQMQNAKLWPCIKRKKNIT